MYLFHISTMRKLKIKWIRDISLNINNVMVTAGESAKSIEMMIPLIMFSLLFWWASLSISVSGYRYFMYDGLTSWQQCIVSSSFQRCWSACPTVLKDHRNNSAVFGQMLTIDDGYEKNIPCKNTCCHWLWFYKWCLSFGKMLDDQILLLQLINIGLYIIHFGMDEESFQITNGIVQTLTKPKILVTIFNDEFEE